MLETFLPTQLVSTVARDPDHPAQAAWDGAALFADISGYTQLTERLSGHAPDGIERLSTILDRSFGRYINVVAAHGGEVAYFAGDALLAWWPTFDEHANTSIELAVTCARALVDLDRASADDERPGLHVGVAFGSLVAARTGGNEHRWEILLAGTAVREACKAMAFGKRDDVVLSPRAVSLLTDRIQGRTLNDNYLRLTGSRPLRSQAPKISPPEPQGTALLPKLVPEVIRDRNPEPDGRWHAELRIVACVCARIGGIDEAAADFLDRLQRAVSTIHEIARAHAGTTGRLILDDKGLVYMLPFGIPLSSHSDDPARALRAAVELSKQVQALGLSCDVGVASGRAFCGVIGNDVRRDYVVIGAPMNRAARLMESAHGHVLTTDNQVSVADLHFGPSSVLHAKGIAEPMLAYRVLRQSVRPARRLPLRNRVVERKRLYAALDELAAGRGGVISVVADAGVGKSRLIEELVEEARSRGIPVAVGACDAAGRSTPYLCWRGVLASILGAAPDAAPSSITELVRQYAASSRQPELLPLLNDLLPLRLAETPATSQLIGDHRAHAVFQVFNALIADRVPEPLLVVLEDCHWIDSASYRLLELLAGHARDVLVIMTTRPSAAGASEHPVHEALQFDTVHLTPLARDDSLLLFKDRLGGDSVNDTVADIVLTATDGNPLFIIEYSSLLRKTGRISCESGSWQLVDRAPLPGEVPANVQRVIASRVDSLSPEESHTLKMASVLGTTFSLQAMRQLAGSHEVLPQLDNLVHQELLTRSGNAEQRSYAFRHVVVRNAVYELMLYEQRRTLHRAAAAALEQDEQPGVAVSAALLAHHWSLAGDADKTLHYADLAGVHALRLGAFPEAIRFFEQCLGLVAARETTSASELRVLQWHRLLSDAHAGLGDLDARCAEARALLNLAGCITHVPRHGSMLELVARLVRHAAVRDYGPRRRERQRDRDTRSVEVAWAYWHLAETAYFEDDLLALLTHTARAIDHAGRAEQSAVLARGYTTLAGALGIAGWESAARRYFNRAAASAEAATDPYTLSYAQMVACLYLVGIGDFAAVLVTVDKCQELCRTLGNYVTWGNAQVVRFWMLHYLGQVETSQRAAEELLERAEQTGNVQQQAWALRRLALVELRSDAAQQAALHLERSLQLLARSKDKNEHVPTWAALALAHLRNGSEAAAIEAFEIAYAEFAKPGRPTAHGILEGLSACAEVALSMRLRTPAAQRWQRAAQVCLGALDRYQRVFPIGIPAFRLWRGVAQLLEGQREAAKQEWQQGLQAAQHLGMQFDERRIARELERLGIPHASRTDWKL